MKANVVDKINAMQHRLMTNAASRKRVFQVQAKRAESVEAPPPEPTDAEDELPEAEAATP